MDALEQIARSSDQKTRSDEYKALVDKYVAEVNIEGLKAFVTHLLQEGTPAVISRQILTHHATMVSKLELDPCKDVSEFAVQQIKATTRGVSYEEPDALYRECLSNFYIEEEEYVEAAKCLVGINMESGGLKFTDEEKAGKYVKIAELYLQEDDTVNAEAYLNRASALMHNVEDWALQLRYKVSYARVLDSKRKFVDAAMRYYDLSQTQSTEVVQDDLLQLLGKALTCALLAAAGSRRTRILGTLYKDERVHQLEHHAVLQKMYGEQLLRSSELTKFEQSLMPHQKAILADGSTVLERAVLEHNMQAASRLYKNIRFSELGALLEIEPEAAERIAATMIVEERMAGSIDQEEGMLQFEGDPEPLQVWDRSISAICQDMNVAVENITRAHPQFEDAQAVTVEP